jgi:type III pantothenate kinase
MLLTADIRNAHTALALFETAEPSGATVAHWRVSTGRRRTADEWVVLVRGLVTEAAATAGLGGLAVAATVPAVLHEWRAMAERHFPGVPLVVVEPGTRTGLSVATDNPREIGADRICNAVAVAERPGPTVVVDFGDATTYDVVTADGRYVGGAITPGIEMSLDALGQGSAQLREVELVRPRSVIARNTVEALQSGLVFGVAAQVEGMVARIRSELVEPEALSVVATGHHAPLVVAECSCFTDHDPLLTLRGLRIVFSRNRPRD